MVWLSLLTLVIYACGSGGGGGGSSDGGGGSGSISISATVGSDYTVAYAPGIFEELVATLWGRRAVALGSGEVVDQVVAVPSWQGHFGGDGLKGMQTASIGRDGGFSLSLARSYDWVLLLVNSQATSMSDKVVSYVSARITEEDTLVTYSGAKLLADMQLGELTRSGDEARGDYDEAAFDLTLDQIKAVAQSDNGYKHLINAYLNYHPATGIFYSAQPIFSWNAGSIVGLDAPPTADGLSAYELDGFTVNVETNNVTDPAVLDEVCNGDVSFGLYPPSAIQDREGNTYDAVNGMVSDDEIDGYDTNIGVPENWVQDGRTYCYDSDFGAQYHGGSNTVLYGFKGARSVLRVPDVVDGGLPAGHWLLKADSSTLAEFDLAVGSPVDAAGNYKIPLPAIQVSHGEGGVITGISVAWFVYNEATAEYQELNPDQMSAVDSLLRDSFIEVQDENGSDPENPVNVHIDQAPAYSDGLVTSLDFSNESKNWYFPGSAGDVSGNLVPTFIKIGMHLAGLEYQFGWHN